MAQNPYDDPQFFGKYTSTYDRRIGEEDGGAFEWASLSKMIPKLDGLSVLDLGCGYGCFCRYARKQGAKDVLGVDISTNMLAKARQMTNDNQIVYRQENLETLELPANSYDLAYSALAFHYIEDLSPLFRTIFKALKPGGSFVFSVEHPVYTAPLKENRIINENGQKSWVLNGYLQEGKRIKKWLVDGIVFYHRLTSTYINLLLESGFQIKGLDEWRPTKEQIEVTPALADVKEYAYFMIIAAVKP